MENCFAELNSVNVNDKVEKKNGLSYLTWAWAWAKVKERYPDARYEVIKFDGRPYFHDEALGYMVFTTVTIGDMTHEMWLPVMDGANKAMKSAPYTYRVKNPNHKYANPETGKDRYGKDQPEFIEKEVNAATMFDVNTAIMRCLVKNLAMFGLGLYIYAGEDLPEEEKKLDENEKMVKDAREKPITKAEINTLIRLCKEKGLDVDETFPSGVDALTGEQYLKALEKLKGVSNKK